MRVKVLLCNCKGLCPSFKACDFNTLPFQIESELEVSYVLVHPQLCGQGGNEVLADVLRESAAAPETYIVCGACAPHTQEKLFQKLLRKTGFDPRRFVAVDIRSTDNEGVLKRMRETVEGMLATECGVPAVK